MAQIVFSIKKTVSGELSTIYVRYFHGRSSDQVTKTGLTVLPDYWSNKKQGIKPNAVYGKLFTSEDAERLTEQLNSLRAHILREANKLPGQEQPAKWLKGVVAAHNGTAVSVEAPVKATAAKEDFNAYLTRFYNEAKAGKALCARGNMVVAFPKASMRGWKNFKELMTIYQQERRIKLDFEDFGRDFYSDFTEWMQARNLTANYTGAMVKKLKNILQRAADEELHTTFEYKKRYFKITSEDVDSVYLTREELGAIAALNLSLDPELAAVRDVFLVGCYTGQRYSDYSRIGPDNIRTTGGRRFIELTQRKTGARVVIPVNDELDEILRRHKNQLPRIHENDLNTHIKAIAQRAKIVTNVEQTRTRGGLKVIENKKKYKLISTHTARRTALTLWYLNGVNEIDLMKLSGHASTKQLMDYIKATPDEVAQRLSLHKAFTSLRVAQ